MTDRPAEPTPADEVDLDRRSFFRTFGRNAVMAAGQVVGAADVLRRGAGVTDPEALTDEPDPGAMRKDARTRGPSSAPLGARSGSAPFRSPYRLVDDGLILVDQRELPEAIVELTCRDGRDVARAMRDGSVSGAPVLGQVAAYAMALTARRHAARRPGALHMELETANEHLRRWRPSARPVHAALERIANRRSALPEDTAADVLADVLRAEADAIASEAASDHAALARHAAAILPRPVDRPLELLVHGSTGAMGGGLVGTCLAVVQLIAAEGRPVHVWLTETRPTLEGARVAAWELRQAGIAHTVIPDGAVAWLITRHPPDAALLGAEWLTASGDAAVISGGAAVAALCATLAAPPVPVVLCAPLSTYDATTPDGSAIPDELWSRRQLKPDGPRRPNAGPELRAPVVDVVDARWLTAIVTEEGVTGPPFGPALTAASDARGRRLAHPVAGH
ncbi:MAG: hypothetical protein H0V04_07895 [Chloroflexi bacterium]|nr:hypothetical protein [Chloroflexota bacterium]